MVMNPLLEKQGYKVLWNFVDQIHGIARAALIQEHRDFLFSKPLVEFGVCHGGSLRSFKDIYSELTMPVNFWGFDSFEGLPVETRDENTIWHPGQFSRDGKPPKDLINAAGINLVKGWFNDTLTRATSELIGQIAFGIVHFDCDTYSSTLESWQWLLDYKLITQGTIIIYDDWGAYLEKGCNEYDIGEAKAHNEISNTYGVKFEGLGRYSVHPDAYVVKIFRISDLNDHRNSSSDCIIF